MLYHFAVKCVFYLVNIYKDSEYKKQNSEYFMFLLSLILRINRYAGG